MRNSNETWQEISLLFDLHCLTYRNFEVIKVRIEFAKSSQADHAALMPGLRREGMRVSFQAEEMLSAYSTFRAAVELAG